MKCPYCGQEMQAGEFRTARDGVIYWMPQDMEYKGLFLTDSKVEAQGGIVLTEESRPVIYSCGYCKLLMTKL